MRGTRVTGSGRKNPAGAGCVGWRLAVAAHPPDSAECCGDCEGPRKRRIGEKVQRRDVGESRDAACDPVGQGGSVLNVELLLHVDLLVPVPPARCGQVALTKRAFEAMSLRARGMTGLQPGPLGPPARGLAWPLSRLVASKVGATCTDRACPVGETCIRSARADAKNRVFARLCG